MKKKIPKTARQPKPEPLVKKTVSYQFLPDTELLDFAKKVSDGYKKLSIGAYYSKDKKYQINYLVRIKADATNNRVSLVFKSLSLTNDAYNGSFTYVVK